MGVLTIYDDYMGKNAKCNGQDAYSMVTKQTYNAVAHTYGHTRCGKGAWREELQYLLKVLPEKRGLRLCDLGCGTGRVLQFLVEEKVHFVHYVGVDYSQAMLREVQGWMEKFFPSQGISLQSGPILPRLSWLARWLQRLKVSSSRIELVEAPMQEIDPQEEAYDVVTMAASFHHLLSREDRETVLELVSWMLAPGGVLYMSNWQVSDALRTKTDLGEGIWKVHFGGKSGGDRYYYQLSAEELTELLLYAGFEDIQHHALSTGNLVTTAKKPHDA